MLPLSSTSRPFRSKVFSSVHRAPESIRKYDSWASFSCHPSFLRHAPCTRRATITSAASLTGHRHEITNAVAVSLDAAQRSPGHAGTASAAQPWNRSSEITESRDHRGRACAPRCKSGGYRAHAWHSRRLRSGALWWLRSRSARSFRRYAQASQAHSHLRCLHVRDARNLWPGREPGRIWAEAPL